MLELQQDPFTLHLRGTLQNAVPVLTGESHLPFWYPASTSDPESLPVSSKGERVLGSMRI